MRRLYTFFNLLYRKLLGHRTPSRLAVQIWITPYTLYKMKKELLHLWGNVREQLNLYGWRLNIMPQATEGYCWKKSKALDVGLMCRGGPKELLIHEIAHIRTARFNNNKHTWDFWKMFVDYMYRFLPGQVISEGEILHMKYGNNGTNSLFYR